MTGGNHREARDEARACIWTPVGFKLLLKGLYNQVKFFHRNGLYVQFMEILWTANIIKFNRV